MILEFFKFWERERESWLLNTSSTYFTPTVLYLPKLNYIKKDKKSLAVQDAFKQKKFQSHWFLFEISACSIDISHAISICDLLYFFGSWGFCSPFCLCIQKLALSWAWISAIILRVNQWFLTGGVLIYFPPWLYQCHIHSTDSRIHAVSRSWKAENSN